MKEAKRIDSENVKMANRIIGSKPLVPVKESCDKYYSGAHAQMVSMISVKTKSGCQMKNLA